MDGRVNGFGHERTMPTRTLPTGRRPYLKPNERLARAVERCLHALLLLSGVARQRERGGCVAPNAARVSVAEPRQRMRHLEGLNQRRRNALIRSWYRCQWGVGSGGNTLEVKARCRTPVPTRSSP